MVGSKSGSLSSLVTGSVTTVKLDLILLITCWSLKLRQGEGPDVSTYREQLEAARKEGRTKGVLAGLWRWEQEGQELVGKILAIDDFKGGKFDEPCKQYIVETDLGTFQTLLGGATDERLGDSVRVGDVVSITYMGKATTSKGFQVNVFAIEKVHAST